MILGLVESEKLPAHLLLGNDAFRFAAQATATRAEEAERWREVTESTDVDASRALPDLKF